MAKTLKVNGYNFTNTITPWGYSISYNKIQGGNQGTMKDGSFVDDVLAYKAVISANCMPLTQTELEHVYEVLYLYEYPTVEFYDPKAKGYRRAECLFTLTPSVERGRGADGQIRWIGTELSFTER